MRLGIVPAAGNAARWDGYPKELLPISGCETFLSRAVDSLKACGCDTVTVVTTPAKIHLHSYHLRDRDKVQFTIQQGEELWAAIRTALDTPSDEYFFLMPDTYLPRKPFPPSLGKEFGIGLFETEEPERFGILRGGKIVDKQPGQTPCLAWGVLAWTGAVAQHWKSMSYLSNSEAVCDAIRVFDYDSWRLDYYFDIGSIEFYIDFLVKRKLQDEVRDPELALMQSAKDETEAEIAHSG